MGDRTFLNIGCGTSGNDRLPGVLRQPEWREVRIDIDPRVNPDIVASFANLNMIPDNHADAIYSSHNLEHLLWHEVQLALKEARRVLKPEGFLFLTLPDIEQVAQLIVDGKLMEVAYEAPAGPITALDMLYGHRDSQANGNPYMAHRSGFTAESLSVVLMEAGFTEIKINKGANYDLWGVAANQAISDEVANEVQARRA